MCLGGDPGFPGSLFLAEQHSTRGAASPNITAPKGGGDCPRASADEAPTPDETFLTIDANHDGLLSHDEWHSQPEAKTLCRRVSSMRAECQEASLSDDIVFELHSSSERST